MSMWNSRPSTLASRDKVASDGSSWHGFQPRDRGLVHSEQPRKRGLRQFVVDPVADDAHGDRVRQ